jgi:hypothetical protein
MPCSCVNRTQYCEAAAADCTAAAAGEDCGLLQHWQFVGQAFTQPPQQQETVRMQQQAGAIGLQGP